MNSRGRPTLLGAGLLIAMAAALPAGAQDSADATGTVAVQIRSISVSVTSFDFDTCTLDDVDSEGKLSFPNGRCRGPVITVTNGEAPSNVNVRATDFEGSDGGSTWALCAVAGPACTGSGGPGVDEASLQVNSADFGLSFLVTTTDRCDANFLAAGECVADPGQQEQEVLDVIGPEGTTNGSASFSTTVTWSALP